MASEMKIKTTDWRGKTVTLTPEEAAKWAMSPHWDGDEEGKRARDFTALLVQMLVNKCVLTGADMSTLLGSGFEVIE